MSDFRFELAREQEEKAYLERSARCAVKYRVDLVHTYPTPDNPKCEPVRDTWFLHDEQGEGVIERIREKVAKLNQVVRVLSVRPMKRD